MSKSKGKGKSKDRIPYLLGIQDGVNYIDSLPISNGTLLYNAIVEAQSRKLTEINLIPRISGNKLNRYTISIEVSRSISEIMQDILNDLSECLNCPKLEMYLKYIREIPIIESSADKALEYFKNFIVKEDRTKYDLAIAQKETELKYRSIISLISNKYSFSPANASYFIHSLADKEIDYEVLKEALKSATNIEEIKLIIKKIIELQKQYEIAPYEETELVIIENINDLLTILGLENNVQYN